jgi:hypothetical protein
VIDRDSRSKQHPHRLRVSAFGSANEPRTVEAVPRIDICAVVERYCEQREKSFAGRDQESALYRVVLRVDIGPLLDQSDGFVDIVSPGGGNQQSVQIIVHVGHLVAAMT